MSIIGRIYFYSECVGGYINDVMRGTKKENTINLLPLFYLIPNFCSYFSGISSYLKHLNNSHK